MQEKETLYLFDAYALIYRAYFAMSKNPLINSKGFNTSAISGFTNSLFEILTKYNPNYAAVVFDAPSTTDRKAEYDFYKANRQSMPEDIAVSIPYIKSIIEGFNIPIIQLDGYEADDLIGTIAKKVDKTIDVYMVTPDKDFAQLVDKNIFIHKPPYMGKGHEILGVDEIKKKWEVENPLQVIDILGLWGDAVDNIPGIPGVGEKTAKKFVKAYGSIEGLYKNTEQLKGKMKEKVIENEEMAFISKQLATIIIDAPIQFDKKTFRISKPNKKKLEELFIELEFRTLGKRIIGDSYKFIGTVKTNQPTLFDTSNDNQNETAVLIEEKNIDTVDHNYSCVDNEKEITKLFEKLNAASAICFDTETTGLNALTNELVGLSFSIKSFEAYYIPYHSSSKDLQEKIIELTKKLLENKTITKIGQNLKYDILVLRKYGIYVHEPYFDTMLAHYVLKPDSRHNMNILAEDYLGYSPISIETLIGKKGPKQKNMRDVPINEITPYACEDADITYQLYEALNKEIKDQPVETVFKNVELPLINVLADMEEAGITINKTFLDEYSKKLNEELLILKSDIYTLSGAEFNLDSPKQLGNILFERMDIKYVGKKTKTGQFSTSEDTLLKLEEAHEIIPKILSYRQITKLKSTYVDALPLLINKNTNKIHTTFNQSVAATGRLSSVNPNLQNIPIRTERGRKIREAFIASKDRLFFAADYSQIELRIIASISEDKRMIEAFSNNLDIHSSTAANVFGVSLENVTREMRRKAKVVNFGIIYGISAFGLAQRLKIKRTEAAEIIEAYFKQYEGIKKYMVQTVEWAKEHGYVETILGRRRYLRDINSRNATVRGFAERNAINAPIQGSAADMIKIAMINIHKKMNEKGLKSKMTLQVHDELIFDVVPDEMNYLKEMVEIEMQNALPLKVPVEVGMGDGKTWLEAH